ncbi:MAG: hypothetical protein LJE62_08145 [Silicimonas sp.]|nr:hypothetical protein [Silicimonas sp.]
MDTVSPRSIMRLLVISYFFALSLGLIGGSRIVDFVLPVLPHGIADPLMRGLTLGLSALVLFGIGRRPAALVLSLIVFYSSYTALYSGGDIGTFWRDLALVGALLMTADFTRPGDREIEWPPLDLGDPASNDTDAPEPEPVDPLNDDHAFREDFDIARTT